MTDIKEILDQIAELNINQCAYTTYDMGIIECTRQRIIASLARAHNIEYHIKPQGQRDFPVTQKKPL